MATVLDERSSDSTPGWGALLAIGIVILILGIAAIMLPMAGAFAADLVIAWIALFIGALQLVYAYQTRTERGVAWRVVSAVINVALGFLLLGFPLQGVQALALLFGVLVLAMGISEIVLAFHIRPLEGWGWVLALGIVSAVAGLLLAATWPQNSFWVLGFYVGLSMISGGVSRIALALALRKRRPQAPLEHA